MITPENCTYILNKHLDDASGDKDSQAAAWNVVYLFCQQRGMKADNNMNGIQSIIGFLDKYLPKE